MGCALKGFFGHLNILPSLIGVYLLSACGSTNSPAPIEELGGRERYLNEGREHRVNDGETLYVIAWLYDLDYKELARVNSLQPPYPLAEGDKLRVDIRTSTAVSASNKTNNGSVLDNGGVIVNAVTSPSGAATRVGGLGGRIQRRPLPDLPPPSQPDQILTKATPVEVLAESGTNTEGAQKQNIVPSSRTTQLVKEETPTERATALTGLPIKSSARITAPDISSGSLVNWEWPSSGKLISKFQNDSPDSKGLDFGGNKGDAVLAAADGEVVYAGNGLLRYGNLIILKHNDDYLSAYAHNDRMIVREGAKVLRGQRIAELGSSGISENKLHFEIRYKGTPVDPEPYLPKR
jgi:lipoprotein NlpD